MSKTKSPKADEKNKPQKTKEHRVTEAGPHKLGHEHHDTHAHQPAHKT